MRLEAHTKQLSKELRSARAALEQERKLRKVQSDTIKVREKVLWKKLQPMLSETVTPFCSAGAVEGDPVPTDGKRAGLQQLRQSQQGAVGRGYGARVRGGYSESNAV